VSQQNVETACRWLEAPKATRDEVRSAALELWHADGWYHPVAKFPETRPCNSREEIIEWHGQFRDTWSDDSLEVQRVLAVRDDRVLASVTLRSAGRMSEVSSEGDLHMCVWLQNGRLIRRRTTSRWLAHSTPSGSTETC
jgi:hypothetical protein